MFVGPLFFKPIKSNFQALFKENCQISRQIEKSSTFQDSSQIQALFNVCGKHAPSIYSLMCQNRSLLEFWLEFKSSELELKFVELELEWKLKPSCGIGNSGIGTELKTWNWPQPWM